MPSPRLALVVLLAAGCGGQQKNVDDLIDSARGYHEGVRWRRYEDAAARRVPAEREAFLDERSELDEDLRIDDYEIERVKIRTGHKAAILQVKYTWHLDSVGVVHDTVVVQAWEHRGRDWLLVTEYRKRGEPMPGVAEAPEGEETDAPEEPEATAEETRNP